MNAAFFTKLQTHTRLSPAEIEALDELFGPAETVRPNHVLIREGERQSHGTLLVEGWAIRFRLLADGRRQVTGFVLPGDLCDPTFFVARSATHSVATITPATFRAIGGLELMDLLERQPRINVAFWWLAAHEKALLHEQLVAVGQQTAYERAAFQLWELWRRMELAGLMVNDGFRFPVTQAVLADALGLSTVHTNRILQKLRGDGLIVLHAGALTIRDPAKLRAVAEAGDERILLDGSAHGARRDHRAGLGDRPGPAL